MAAHISADEEREYYDGLYKQYLAYPDEDLAFGYKALAADLTNPHKPVFERRLLFTLALQALLSEQLAGCRVLEYGCGTADWGLVMAERGANVTLLDLSPVAIEVGLRRARASGVAGRVVGVARDASDLPCFDNGAFDLIFAAFSLHHTLKHTHALRELQRILTPGGKLILAETYGNNPILNGARTARRILSREPREQGEGIVIGDAEIGNLARRFERVTLQPVNLLGMAKRVFRGHFGWRPVSLSLHALEAVDRYILRRFPGLQRYCGEVLVTAVK